MKIVMKAIVALSLKIANFTASDLAEKVNELYDHSVGFTYNSRQASYDLKKLRGKGLIQLPPRSHCYEATREGLKQMTAFRVLQEKVLLPLLSNACKRTRGPKPYNISQIDRHYENIQIEMQNIFQHLKIAA